MNDFEKLLIALVSPAQDIENMFQQLLTQRGLQTAVGVQLDQLGALVGCARAGNPDDTYRRYIGAQILVNQSCGQINRLLLITRVIINDPTATLKARFEPNATVVIFIGESAVTYDVASGLIVFIRAAKAGGVRLILKFSEYPADETFTLDSGPGLDIGHLAGALE
jgi:hypothetical protein